MSDLAPLSSAWKRFFASMSTAPAWLIIGACLVAALPIVALVKAFGLDRTPFREEANTDPLPGAPPEPGDGPPAPPKRTMSPEIRARLAEAKRAKRAARIAASAVAVTP